MKKRHKNQRLSFLSNKSQHLSRRYIPRLFCIGSFAIILSLTGQSQKLVNIDNPVLPGVADAGVIKYNGEYYIGGVFTNGSFFVSEDLKKWEGPVPVFSMDNEWTGGASAGNSQIHADDINYINGLFHLFWSVNYWGKDKNVIHIGHAVSPNVLGPYHEPVKDAWVDNRIDPELFVDDDGKTYLYMVKFTDGNTIWVQPMKDPWTAEGEPRYLFSSLPNTWETADNRVEEGPWVIKYRDRYYLMYNANHTSTEWGNYALGVAEADSPLDFNHANKYPYPVVKSNQVDLEDTYADLLKYTGEGAGLFYYTFDQPAEGWEKSGQAASGWQLGKVGFGSSVIKGSATRKVGTLWNTQQIWVKRSFVFEKNKNGNLMLRINHDGDTRVFLNGQPIYEREGRNYTTWNFDQKAAGLLKEGENVLAIHSTQGRRSGYLDVSLFDLQDQRGDDILYSPGQPNILRGPNGFEWWLIYMANKNGDPRGQYINRVQFFDKRMFVDGITGSNTEGYHPYPACATFSDLFNTGENNPGQDKWQFKAGRWAVRNKELIQSGNGRSQALINSTPSTHYLFEAGVQITDTVKAKAGVVGFWKDENNWLKIFLDARHKTWSYTVNESGKQKTSSYPLRKDFTYGVYHKFSVYKNGAVFTVKLDDLPLPITSEIRTSFTAKGLPGLYTEGGNAAFDGVLYTIGWDEYDATIRGWETPASNKGQTNSWTVNKEGITAAGHTGEYSLFKGDLLPAYEFSAQVTVKDHHGSAGIYPVYIDGNNYLKAVFDFKRQRFVVSGKMKGKEIDAKELTLENSQDYHADMKYTDFFEKCFTLSAPTYINAIRLSKIPLGRQDTLIEDMYKKMMVQYKYRNKWYPLTAYQEDNSLHPGFDQIGFKPVEAEALKFTNKEPGDLNFYINKIWVNEVFKNSYNIRVTRLKGEIIFWVDGKEVMRMKEEFPPSRVGLIANDTQACFNGITLFHLPD